MKNTKGANGMDVNRWSIRRLAGQRLMIGFDGTGMTDRLAFCIERLKVAGIILFSRNIEHPDQVRALCADAQDCAHACRQPPLLIAVDQEGGQVARFREHFTLFEGNPAMTGEADAERFARITARELSEIGVNMNYAPVMDIAWEGVDSVMAARAFRGGPERVARLGASVIRRLQKGRVMSVAKHFPGIGRTTLDSHMDLPVLDTAPEVLAAGDYLPFEAAVESGVAGVMLSHILYRRIDPQWPASLSTTIADGLLRGTMGYGGVVMTDDLDMGAIKGRWPVETLMQRIVAADIDLALICHEGPDIDAAFDALVKNLEGSAALLDAARRSAGRVMALKEKYLGGLTGLAS